MTTAFYHDECCLWHTTGEHMLFLPVGGPVQPPSGGGHAESPETKRRLKNLLEVSGLWPQLDVRSADPVTEADLARVHDARYLRDFRALSDAGGGELGYDSPFGRGSYEIACLSAGLAKRGLRDVWTRAVANAYILSRPPGHHCQRDRAMGFCLLANIPLALEALRAEFGPIRVAVVDWDVHHGNGTEAIYEDRADTLTISLHQEACFPVDTGGIGARGRGAGLGYNLNIPLIPGMGHQSYLDAFDILVEPALRAFAPQMIVIASGLDASPVDPLARMQATSDTFRLMTRRVKALADQMCGGRLALVHEGGYSELQVPFCGLAILEELTGRRTGVIDPLLDMAERQQPAPDVLAFQRSRLLAQADGLAGR